MVWDGESLDPTKYIVELSTHDIRDIRAAVIKVKSMFMLKHALHMGADLVLVAGIPRSEICKATFDLSNPALAYRLSSLSHELHAGTGVVVLRGLDKARFNDEEAVIAFAGICSYVCPERATDSYANQTLSMSSRSACKDTH